MARRRRPALRRALVFLYEDARADRDVRATPDDDDVLRRMYARAVAVHTDAWVLHGVHALPRWWRLVAEIRAENLTDEPRDRVTWPMAEAAMRVSGLQLEEAPHTADGWRRVRSGPDKGKIVKIQETRATARLVEGVPDRTIHHPEAFPADPDAATVHGGDPATARLLIPEPLQIDSPQA